MTTRILTGYQAHAVINAQLALSMVDAFLLTTFGDTSVTITSNGCVHVVGKLDLSNPSFRDRETYTDIDCFAEAYGLG